MSVISAAGGFLKNKKTKRETVVALLTDSNKVYKQLQSVVRKSLDILFCREGIMGQVVKENPPENSLTLYKNSNRISVDIFSDCLHNYDCIKSEMKKKHAHTAVNSNSTSIGG